VYDCMHAITNVIGRCLGGSILTQVDFKCLRMKSIIHVENFRDFITINMILCFSGWKY